MSKQTWKVMIAVIFTFGVVVSFFYFIPLTSWRPASSQKIPLVFPGESQAVSFSDVSLEEFLHLSLDTSYYQFSNSQGIIYVKALGIKDKTLYQASGMYEAPLGFGNDYHYSAGILSLEENPNLYSYFIATSALLITIVIVCLIITGATHFFVKENK